jgi:hypothetical protein
MTVDWRPYDAFDWHQAAQPSLDDTERANIEKFVADVLALSATDRAANWGAASPPGRYAATVIHVHPEVTHRYQSEMARAHIPTIGVKVFKTNRDTQREVRHLLSFHATQIATLPGIPHDRLQRVLFANTETDPSGQPRAYLTQEWISGVPLNQLLSSPQRPQISTAVARSIVHQLLAVITAPLWSVGTIWWDFRDANYCYDPNIDQLTMIDVDSLAAYAAEILQSPSDWTRRDKGRHTALARLRQMTLRIVLATGRPGRKQTEALLHSLWQPEIIPVFSRLGHEGTATDADIQVRRFLDRLFAQPSG